MCWTFTARQAGEPSLSALGAYVRRVAAVVCGLSFVFSAHPGAASQNDTALFKACLTAAFTYEDISNVALGGLSRNVTMDRVRQIAQNARAERKMLGIIGGSQSRGLSAEVEADLLLFVACEGDWRRECLPIAKRMLENTSSLHEACEQEYRG